jgi:hypothetical protein
MFKNSTQQTEDNTTTKRDTSNSFIHAEHITTCLPTNAWKHNMTTTFNQHCEHNPDHTAQMTNNSVISTRQRRHWV